MDRKLEEKRGRGGLEGLCKGTKRGRGGRRERKKRTRGQSGRKEKKEDGWRRIGGSVEQVEIKVATPKPDAKNPCDGQDFRRAGRGMEYLPTYHLS